jgi:hypothetical protein
MLTMVRCTDARPWETLNSRRHWVSVALYRRGDRDQRGDECQHQDDDGDRDLHRRAPHVELVKGHERDRCPEKRDPDRAAVAFPPRWNACRDAVARMRALRARSGSSSTGSTIADSFSEEQRRGCAVPG